MNRYLFYLVFLLFCSSTHAVVELNFDFDYDRKIYGENRQNKAISRTFSSSFAFYFLGKMGLELSYSKTEDSSQQNFTIDPDVIYSMKAVNSVMTNQVFSLGLRLALAEKRSLIVPVISLGYAKQYIDNEENTIIYDSDSSSDITLTYVAPREILDSAFASLSLNINLTSRLGLRGSIKTLFEAFEFDQARDNIQYFAGINIYL